MSISHKELMELRRAHLAEKEKHSDAQQDPLHTRAMKQPSPPRTREPGPSKSAIDKHRSNAGKGTQPKVFARFQTVVGHVPRQELIRRRRQEFDSVSVESLLAEKGIDYYKDGVGGMIDEAPGGRSMYHRLLPLEAFDDFSFDELSPQDWMAKGVDEESGEQVGVPALAVLVEGDRRGKWTPCRVVQWSETEHKLLVHWDDTTKRTWLPRIHVCFRAEDPRRFADRVAAAHERRKEAEAVLRLNLYVESMPVDDYQVLDLATTERIRDLSINTTVLLNNEDSLDVQSVLKGINAEYGRTMNKLLFDQAATQNGALAQVFRTMPLPKPLPAAQPPVFGQVQIAPHNFGNAMRALHANTYLNHQEEVCLALHRIRDECDQVLTTNVFVVPPNIDSHRPMVLDDFDELETTSITQRQMMLKDQWAANIKEHIKDSLSKTNSEDEVNLHVSSKEEYEGSKMQRLMNTVKFIMQDTLYYLMTASLESFVLFIESSCNFTVSIRDLAVIEIGAGPLTDKPPEMGHDRRAIEKPNVKVALAPLFRVSLKEEEKKVCFTTPTENFSKVLTAIFDKAITQHQDISQIESQVIEFIFAPQTPVIPCIGLQHPLVVSWRKRLQAAVTHAVAPLEAYLDTYKPFKDLLEIDVSAYIKQYEEANHTVKQMEKEAQKHLDRQAAVLNTIPQTVNLGCFLVDCQEFRKKLAEKCGVLAQKVHDLLARVSRKKAEEIEDKFSSIRSVLIRPVETPEDVVKVKEYMKTIPEQVFDLQSVINEMGEVYDVLDKFQYALTDDDFSKKWKAIGWPARLDEDVVRTNQNLESQRKMLTDVMEKNQESFAKEVEKLQKQVAAFYKRTDIKKVTEIANEVKGVVAEIQKAREQANQFNQHEALFERDKTDYSGVHQLAKDFEPYQLLWVTADDWIQWHHGWTNDPFESIDADEMEKNAMQAAKNIAKVVREPRFKDKAPILKIAEDLKAQIDEFKPIIPTVKHLRQQGMKERHWNQLSKELAFDVRPGVSLLTLQDVYGLELQLHDETIMRISEVAAREYGIETSLLKMKRDWEDMKLKVRAYKKTGCFIIPKETVDETQDLLDDHTLTTQALAFSPFKKIFEKEIEEWEANLKLVQAILDEWKTCQKSWMYLEPIFQSEDIVRQLPEANRQFTQVNKNWKMLTTKANEIQHTMPYCVTTEKCLATFKENNDLLEKVQKGLNQYLENKRSSFARFYFLSDDELLTILSEAKDPQKIQPHFRKLFENIFKIEMKEGDNEMCGMYSQMNEFIAFKESVYPRKHVENWLSEVEAMMKRSIRNELEKGMKEIQEKGREKFISGRSWTSRYLCVPDCVDGGMRVESRQVPLPRAVPSHRGAKSDAPRRDRAQASYFPPKNEPWRPHHGRSARARHR